MSNKKRHAKPKVITINFGATVGHRYVTEDAEPHDDTEPKPGYHYQDFGGAAYSTLRQYEVNKLLTQVRKGMAFSSAYLYHFTDDWATQFGEMVALGGFHADPEGWLYAALRQTGADNFSIARIMVSNGLIKGWFTSDLAREYGAEHIFGGNSNPFFGVWSEVVEDADKTAKEHFAERLNRELPEATHTARRVRL